MLTRFAVIARFTDDEAFAGRCEAEAARLRDSIEQHGWDGAWYRRAYFDSGEPLGSASNLECQIDSLPQSWSMLTQAGSPARARQAMEAARSLLSEVIHSGNDKQKQEAETLHQRLSA